MLQQLRNPLRITDIAFATGHPLHVRGVEQPHHHDLFQAVERLRQRDEVDSIAAILTPISTAEGAGMIVELRVGEQRYRAVWEVLDGASVTEGRVGSRVSRQACIPQVQRVGPANPSGRRSAALRTTQDLCRQQERQSWFRSRPRDDLERLIFSQGIELLWSTDEAFRSTSPDFV